MRCEARHVRVLLDQKISGNILEIFGNSALLAMELDETAQSSGTTGETTDVSIDR
jgi:hypothetical protein